MAELEGLDLGLDARGLDALRHLAQDVGGGEEGAVAEIERAAIERADLGAQLLDVDDALGAVRHVGLGAGGLGFSGSKK